MRVREVTERTGLTRKALYYYEEIGIVTPVHDPANNYREYGNDDVRMLSMVAGLLQLGVAVGDIRGTVRADGSLEEHNTAEILERRLICIDDTIHELKRQRNLISACVEPDSSGLVERLTVAARAAIIDERERSSFMKKQLVKAFPGSFGRAMSAIFSPFLTEPIDTPEKERAWLSLVEAVDEFDPLVLPDAIQTLSEGIDDGVSLLHEIEELESGDPVSTKLGGEDARLAVRTAEYLVHHAGSFLEPFFGFLEVLSSRFRIARRTLIKIARSLEEESSGPF